MNKAYQLILASNSPRRQLLLKEAGINFSIRTKDIPEIYPPSLAASEVPVYLAKLKAEAFKEEISSEIILTADTVVLLENEILGKPESPSHAVQMLQKLSGKMHQVITGVSIYSRSKEMTFSDVTEVYFKKIPTSDIRHYVQKYKPLDKAGAYGVQEWIGLVGVERINGSYFNVMGLPVHRVVEELEKFDIKPFQE